MSFLLAAALGCVMHDTGLSPLREAPAPDERPRGQDEHLGDAPGADPDDDPGPPGDRLFAPGVVQDLALELSDAALASLAAAPGDEVAGTLVWRGVTYAAAVKLKGTNSFRPIDQKPSFKIDVHAFDDDRRIDGLKRLTLNNMIQDPTMLREHAYSWLAAALDVPAPRHGYARLVVNGAAYGVYGLVETMDGRAMERLFPDDPDGNLYEGSGCDFVEGRDWFDLQVDGGVAAPYDDIDDLVDAVDDAGQEGFVDALDAHFDADRVLRYLALDTVAGNDDGYVFNHHNYHVYHLPTEDRWVLLPWGTDRAFTRDVPPEGTLEEPVVGVLAQRCQADAGCAGDLHEALEDVLAVWEDDAFEDMLDATAEMLAGPCAADPRREYGCRPEDLTDFVDRRAAEVWSAIE